eukprot:m.262693 g.262693  ORF g.262693 m.262693 type:complete len:1058 (-) comp46733_c0_seq1:105-3278(-)
MYPNHLERFVGGLIGILLLGDVRVSECLVTTLKLQIDSGDTILMGQTSTFAVSADSLPAPSVNGTVIWPFVNGSQWGSFVTCGITSMPSSTCTFLLPFPVAGATSVQVAILEGGRTWCSSPASAQACQFPVGQSIPTNQTLIGVSNTVAVDVGVRMIAPSLLPANRSVCMEWEPWFTPNNLGSVSWLNRAGAEGVPLVGLYHSFDPLVVRQHAIWLAEAGVNCILVDWSNNIWSKANWTDRLNSPGGISELVHATSFAIAQYSDLRTEGLITPPNVVVMVGLANGAPSTAASIPELAKEIAFVGDYVKQFGRENFLTLPRSSKPVVVVLANGVPMPSSQVTEQLNPSAFFDVRYMGAQLEDMKDAGKLGWWSWMDGTMNPIVAKSQIDGHNEAITAAAGYFADGGWLATDARGTWNGSTLAGTMAAAIAAAPDVVLVCQWNEFAGQPDSSGSFVDSYNVTFTNDMEPISMTECGYVHKDDASQTPRCDSGWGFRPLNVLKSSVHIYAQSLIPSTPTEQLASLVRILSPHQPGVKVGELMQLEWTVLGPAYPTDILLDGKIIKSVAAGLMSTVIDLRNRSSGSESVSHTLQIVLRGSKQFFALSNSKVDSALATNETFEAFVETQIFISNRSSSVISAAVGFAKVIGGTPSDLGDPYAYGPSLLIEKGVVHAFYCSPGEAHGPWDYIRHSTSFDGLSWSKPTKLTLSDAPNNPWASSSACDPSVIQFKGTYFMYYTCINNGDRNGDKCPLPQDNYKNNRVCVAISETIEGPWVTGLQPVVQDLSCDPNMTQGQYCIGQPSAVVKDDSILLYYSSIGANGDPTQGPNPGRILGATSSDGFHFDPFFEPISAPTATVYGQHNADVKYDRSSDQFLMVQGDVGSSEISWSISEDGFSWLPYNNGSRAIVTNSDLPKPCTPPCSNNNPGLAALPDGSFSGSTFVLYGSSYTPTGGGSSWGSWHLYRSNIDVDATNGGGCRLCAPNGCDLACSANANATVEGTCAFPGSTDPGSCCSCGPVVNRNPCSECAPTGCLDACRSAGHVAGACGAGKDPQDCCVCFP